MSEASPGAAPSEAVYDLDAVSLLIAGAREAHAAIHAELATCTGGDACRRAGTCVAPCEFATRWQRRQEASDWCDDNIGAMADQLDAARRRIAELEVVLSRVETKDD